MPNGNLTNRTRRYAYIGDAVIALVLREELLRMGYLEDSGKMLSKIVSNNFLKHHGTQILKRTVSATSFEMIVGRIYEKVGLERTRSILLNRLGFHKVLFERINP